MPLCGREPLAYHAGLRVGEYHFALTGMLMEINALRWSELTGTAPR
jgi:hypothetical protein